MSETSDKYPLSEEMELRLEREGTYHAPKNDQVYRYELLRYEATQLKRIICQNTPPSREQSLALTAIDEATFWANAAIARNE